jgi:hypothetical protein
MRSGSCGTIADEVFFRHQMAGHALKPGMAERIGDVELTQHSCQTPHRRGYRSDDRSAA